MDAKTRQEMYRLAEAFSMKAHETGLALRPVLADLDVAADQLKRAQDVVNGALLKISGLPAADKATYKEDLHWLQHWLVDAKKTSERNLDSVEKASKVLKVVVARVDADLRK